MLKNKKNFTPEQQIKQDLYNKFTNDDLLLYVLNDSNKLITQIDVEKLLFKYGVKYKVNESYIKRDFKNDKSIRLALTKDKSIEVQDKTNKQIFVTMIQPNLNPDITPLRKDKIKKTLELETQSYERLEFLGDSVIRLILTDYLYERYQDQYEGFLTRLRTKLENGETMAEITKKIGLNQYMIIGRYFEQQNARLENQHMLEDLLEAFIGALYKDSNLDICRQFIINLVEKEIDIAQLLYVETNYKDTLLQHHHKMGWTDPEYNLVEQIGMEKRIFKMCVKDNDGKITGIGSGSSKKKGEQEAAKNALISYGVINENESDDEYDYN
jgi:dsRNA-specific ribonuclease